MSGRVSRSCRQKKRTGGSAQSARLACTVSSARGLYLYGDVLPAYVVVVRPTALPSWQGRFPIRSCFPFNPLCFMLADDWGLPPFSHQADCSESTGVRGFIWSRSPLIDISLQGCRYPKHAKSAILSQPPPLLPACLPPCLLPSLGMPAVSDPEPKFVQDQRAARYWPP